MLGPERILTEDEYFAGLDNPRAIDLLARGVFADLAMIGWDGAKITPVRSYPPECILSEGELFVLPIQFRSSFSGLGSMSRVTVSLPAKAIVDPEDLDTVIGYVRSYGCNSWRDLHCQSIGMNSLGACGHSEL